MTDGRRCSASSTPTIRSRRHALDRTQRVRDAVAAVGADRRVLVGGGSAERLDLRNGARRDLKVVVPLALGVVLLTLIVLLRALVAPLYLLATVVLSFAATLGLTTAILAFGFGLDDFNVVLPLIIFIFLVALGSDYNIFLMSRVREEAGAPRHPRGHARRSRRRPGR